MKPIKGLKKHRLIDNTSKVIPQTTAWVLEIPHGDTLYEPFVRANRPMLETNIETRWGFGDDDFRYNGIRRWSDLYVEFYDTDNWGVIREWGGLGKKNLTLKKVDPTGIVIESWYIVGALLEEYRIINDYGEDIMSVNLRFDHAVLRT